MGKGPEAFIPVQVLDEIRLQDLYGEETHPNGAVEGRFGAALEEVLHWKRCCT